MNRHIWHARREDGECVSARGRGPAAGTRPLAHRERLCEPSDENGRSPGAAPISRFRFARYSDRPSPRPVLESADMSMFPPLSLSPPYPLVGLRAADLSSTYLVVTFVAFTVLFWDWACQISNERDLVWNAKPAYGHGLARRQAWWQPGQRWTKWCFLSSRYVRACLLAWR